MEIVDGMFSSVMRWRKSVKLWLERQPKKSKKKERIKTEQQKWRIVISGPPSPRVPERQAKPGVAGPWGVRFKMGQAVEQD